MATKDALKKLWIGDDPDAVRADGIRYKVTVALAAGVSNPVQIELTSTDAIPYGVGSVASIVSQSDIGDVVDVVRDITITGAKTLTCTRVHNDRQVYAGDWFHIGVNSLFIQSIRDALAEVDIRTALP